MSNGVTSAAGHGMPGGKNSAVQRVLIIGPGGAGKSTLARRISALGGLPVVHLDREYWKPGWVATPKNEWNDRVSELVTQPRWIIDGNYSGTLAMRVAAADTVIFLDFPRRVYLRRVIMRWRNFRGASRPDVAEGCPERLTVQFLLWLWRYRTRTRPSVIALLAAGTRATIVCLQSDIEVEQYLATVAA